ncbi:TIGR04104 family putative zinc finger protein [Desulfotomaculum sp. 1211_IL3151]|uniref:TIGR04104 family putative zinc finger protein n=1 Tax=Desulfotomaculum sp. 1211_IL3151 TaxID=3084055 RepID=UPI002FD88DE3
MSIVKCKNCSYQFKYLNILKSILLCYKPIKCPECKEDYKINILSRVTGAGMLNFFIVRSIEKKIELNPIIDFALYIIIFISLILLAPFLARLDPENNT